MNFIIKIDKLHDKLMLTLQLRVILPMSFTNKISKLPFRVTYNLEINDHY